MGGRSVSPNEDGQVILHGQVTYIQEDEREFGDRVWDFLEEKTQEGSNLVSDNYHNAVDAMHETLNQVFDGIVDFDRQHGEYGVSTVQLIGEKNIELWETGIEFDQEHGGYVASGVKEIQEHSIKGWEKFVQWSNENHVVDRTFAGLQAVIGSIGTVGCVVLIVAPEPGTTATGVILIAPTVDQAQAGWRTLFQSNEEFEQQGNVETLAYQSAEWFALRTGATPEQANAFAGFINFGESLASPAGWLKYLKQFKYVDEAFNLARSSGQFDTLVDTMKLADLSDDKIEALIRAKRLSPEEAKKLKKAVAKARIKNGITVTKAEIKNVSLDEIHYSQKTVSPEMSGKGSGKTSISDVAKDMKVKGWDTTQPPPDMIRHPDGHIQTLDHRRVMAAKEAKLTEIPAKIHPYNESIPKAKAGRFKVKGSFTDPNTGKTYYKGDIPKTWGEAAMFRSANQGKDFPLGGSKNLPKRNYGSGN